MTAQQGCTFANEIKKVVVMSQSIIQFDKQNVEQQKAFDLVANTNTCLFITGKAGTGKTTFVRRIQEEIDKNFLVLAPTGIAAIAVGGQTIHSFFGFPMDVIGPHTKLEVSYESKMILKRIDTIIVDEASMVRCDMVDGMDRYLRMAFSTNMPFGGKQIVFVGDLFQLQPVVRKGSEEEKMLCDLYGSGTPYFFKANILKRMNLPKIEFQKVYRQNDADFLNVLNKIRTGDVKEDDLTLLNEHVKELKNEKDFVITLTAFNHVADKINEKRLNEIEGDEYCYIGEISGSFKAKDSPAPEYLRLKEGCQVIFCRNYYSDGCMNGTIAKVVKLEENGIVVKLGNGEEVNVARVVWECCEKKYNKESRKMESQVVGTYTQFPLKLAWAITIHKSQGMTFDRMHLDLSRGMFLPGQAYVAISRMRTLDGLTLSNRIMPHHVIQNPEARAFANSFNDNEMIDDEIETGKAIYSHLYAKDYDKAVSTCLHLVIQKTNRGDYRNAALLAKRMFDMMLDDECLLGMTDEMTLLKDCSMTCSFLNALFCLYGHRYEEAIGYADMVLSRRQCLEALFMKGRALFELGRIDEAYDVNYKIITISKESEEKKEIDKKLYLFEAKVNERIGNHNFAICEKLKKLCPENEIVNEIWKRSAQKEDEIHIGRLLSH